MQRLFLSLGDQGIFYSDGACQGHLPVLGSPVVSVTGGGDAFMAGLAHAWLQEQGIMGDNPVRPRFAPPSPSIVPIPSFPAYPRPPLNACWRSTHVERLPRYPTWVCRRWPPASQVALESTIISHGMPYPQNVETARQVEQVVRDNGAVPATIAIIDGRLKGGSG